MNAMLPRDMIPQEKIDAVNRGLREAFGVTEFEDISRITRGQTSSLVFRIVGRGSPYLLKIINHRDDPARHYTSMKAAAEAGLAHASCTPTSKTRFASPILCRWNLF